MFINVFSSIFIGASLNMIVGMAFVIRGDVWYEPRRLIPVMGMLLGNSLTGVSLGLNTILKEVVENRERVDIALAYGASRFEAILPIAKESLRNALLPTFNQMSVMGLIAIPGMMTGQILGGVSPMVAVKYQQAIMFLISSCTGMSTLGAILTTIFVIMDEKHRLRLDRIQNQTSYLSAFFLWSIQMTKALWSYAVKKSWTKRNRKLPLQDEDGNRLLG
eukprot:Sdes_comp19289_c0_seq4m10337